MTALAEAGKLNETIGRVRGILAPLILIELNLNVG